MKRLIMSLIIILATAACLMSSDVAKPSVGETSTKTAGISFTSGVVANYGFTYQKIDGMVKPVEINSIDFFIDEMTKTIRTNTFYIYYQMFDKTRKYKLHLDVTPLKCGTLELAWNSSATDIDAVEIDSSNNQGSGYTIFSGALADQSYGMVGLALSVTPVGDGVGSVDWNHVYVGTMTLRLEVQE